MDKTQWIVVGVGCGAFVLGIIFIIMGILSRRKLVAIKETPTVSAAQAAEMADTSGAALVELTGTAESPTPLTAPASGTHCLYYRHNVERLRSREVTDSEGYTHTEEDWITVTDDKNHAPFVMRDDTGEVRVTPDGADFVAQQTMDDQMGAYGWDESEHRSVGGALGGVLGDALDALTTGSSAGYYRTSEWVIPLGQPIYVLGNAERTPTGTEVRKGEGPFIISYKSERELTKKYTLRYVLWLVFGVLFSGGGIAAAVYGSKFMKK